MIVCVCRAVSDRAVRAAAAAGARTVSEVGRACGAGTGCGACHRHIAALLRTGTSQGCGAERRSLDCHAHAETSEAA